MALLMLFGALGVLAGALARLLMGRLRRGGRVPAPWCECAIGLLWAGTGGWWSSGDLSVRWLPLLLGLSWLGVALSAVDVVERRLPDALTLPALPVAVLLAVPLGTSAVGRAILGAGVLFAAHLTVRLVAPSALGAGDVKLAASIGAVLGAVSWLAPLVGVLLASLLTAVVALGMRLVSRARGGPPGEAGVPHGPGMLGAAWLVLVSAAVGGAEWRA